MLFTAAQTDDHPAKRHGLNLVEVAEKERDLDISAAANHLCDDRVVCALAEEGQAQQQIGIFAVGTFHLAAAKCRGKLI